ncbi:hypothetical protein BJ912DRAFT_174445 [Pholiota molesta]|nr:hypothetical protein BJ912DRAFT_174445 [Pholiota molesta]
MKETPLESFEWVGLTHVSRHWRTVGIDSPSLWAEPPLTKLPIPWVKQMLSRSKDTPLVVRTIRASGPTVSSQTVLAVKLALQHSERIKTLSLFVKRMQWDQLQRALPKSAPELQHLSLFSSTYIGPSLELFDLEGILSETPKLRHLELSDFDFNWDTHSHLLRGLTCLKLHNVTISYITWREFSDALEGMPNLQILHLYNALPAAVNERISWAPIHLASLQTIFVHTYPKTVEILLSCITFPPTTKVRFECDVLSVAINLSTLGMRLAQVYSNKLLDTSFQTLILRGPDHSKVELKLFMDALTEEQMLAHHEISAPLEFLFLHMPANAEHFTKAINDVFTAGLTQNINRVYFSEIRFPFQPESLANTIGKLSQLRFLVAKGDAGSFLFNALQLESNQALTGIPSGTLYFPNLSSLYFLGSWFKGSAKHPYHVPVESLRNWLTRRSRSGAGLAKLKFKLCHYLYRKDIDLLRETVQDLEWDEEEVSSDVDEDEDRSEKLAYWHQRQLDEDEDENENENQDEDAGEAEN